MTILAVFIPLLVFGTEWHLETSDTEVTFACKIPLQHNSDSVIGYLWQPDILEKLSSKISNVTILSSSNDSQKVAYTFSFLGYSSQAVYIRQRSPLNSIEVKQVSFQSNWDLFPKPISSQGEYVIDHSHENPILLYSQTVVFDRKLRLWDIFYARVVLSRTVSDLHTIVKEFRD